jgi:hypothetical protein
MDPYENVTSISPQDLLHAQSNGTCDVECVASLHDLMNGTLIAKFGNGTHTGDDKHKSFVDARFIIFSIVLGTLAIGLIVGRILIFLKDMKKTNRGGAAGTNGGGDIFPLETSNLEAQPTVTSQTRPWYQNWNRPSAPSRLSRSFRSSMSSVSTRKSPVAQNRQVRSDRARSSISLPLQGLRPLSSSATTPNNATTRLPMVQPSPHRIVSPTAPQIPESVLVRPERDVLITFDDDDEGPPTPPPIYQNRLLDRLHREGDVAQAFEELGEDVPAPLYYEGDAGSRGDVLEGI